MNNYEVLYVIDGTLGDEAIKEQVNKFTELVTDNGGEIVDVNEWGKRRLAYQINYKSEGYYVLMNFKSEPDFPIELERNFGINENIIRYMVERKVDGYVPPKKVVRAPRPAAKPVEAAAKPEVPAKEVPAKTEAEAPAEAKEEAPAKAEAVAPAEAKEEAPAKTKAEAPAEAKEEAPAKTKAEAPKEAKKAPAKAKAKAEKAPEAPAEEAKEEKDEK